MVFLLALPRHIFWQSADAAALQVRSDTVSAKNSLCINLRMQTSDFGSSI